MVNRSRRTYLSDIVLLWKFLAVVTGIDAASLASGVSARKMRDVMSYDSGPLQTQNLELDNEEIASQLFSPTSL